MKKAYVVTMYRFGDREKHSYVVGVYSSIECALDACDVEEEWRGGNKYVGEITAWVVDIGIEGDADTKLEVVKGG